LAYPAAHTEQALQIMKLLTDDALTDDDLVLLRPLADWADTHRQIRVDDAPKVFLSDCLADERWLPKL
jgi:hypothetical protein